MARTKRVARDGERGRNGQLGPDERSGALPELFVHTSDMDEAQTVGGEVYYPHRVGIGGDASEFGMRIEAVDLGEVLLGWLSYDTEVEVRVAPGDLDDAYQVNIPLAGEVWNASGSEGVVATPELAAVYRPGRGATMHGWGAPSPMLALKFDRAAVENELETLLDRPVRRPIAFTTGLDVGSGTGQQWRSLVQALAEHVGDEQALIRQPRMAPVVAHSVLRGLLLVAKHDHREALDTSPSPARSAAVRRALEFIDSHADQPVSVAEIAAAAGVGTRALHQGFARAMGVSPMRYLRDVRLRRVHADLLEAEPETTGVAEVATQWGFAHLGRFAGYYQQSYGVAPARTLRSLRRR